MFHSISFMIKKMNEFVWHKTIVKQVLPSINKQQLYITLHRYAKRRVGCPTIFRALVFRFRVLYDKLSIVFYRKISKSIYHRTKEALLWSDDNRNVTIYNYRIVY